MKSRGVSFLEMLAMEMKSEGYYVARGLSFTYAPPSRFQGFAVKTYMTGVELA